MLSGGRVNAIGVATAEPLSYFFEDPFARLMMIGITEACDATGIGLSLVSSSASDSDPWSIPSALVDGLILFCLEDADRLIAEAARAPAALRGPRVPRPPRGVPVVGVDNVAGAASPSDHLAGLGHRRFAVLTMELADGPGGRVGTAEVEAALDATSRNG